jgi:hypothetical protein
MFQIVIDHRFHGPATSGNGGYVCGRLASYLDPVATIRLRVPPPLDTPLEVHRTASGVELTQHSRIIAEGHTAELHLEVPPPPGANEAEMASKLYRGFQSHRFPSCFVCGPERSSSDGLRIFAGPVAGRDLVACTWMPEPSLSMDGRVVSPEFIWAALDCPGGFSFPDPEEGKVLLGELTAQLLSPVTVGARYIVMGWHISQAGRKHYTGTALFAESGFCHGIAKATWLEVANAPE